MKACEVADRFWQAKPCRLGPRDRVVVEGSTVSYLLWGHEIARWDRVSGILSVDDCGWQTWLTKDRLNNIVGDVGWGIFSHRGCWRIHYWKTDKAYRWEGSHKIHVETGRIEPATPVVRHPEISEKLKTYYERARGAIKTRRRMLVTRLLDGTAYIFVDTPYRRRVYMLIIETHSPEFEAWSGWLPTSTIYSAFYRKDPLKILAKTRGFDKVGSVEDVLSRMKSMGFKNEDLPEDLASSLAMAKLLEA